MARDNKPIVPPTSTATLGSNMDDDGAPDAPILTAQEPAPAPAPAPAAVVAKKPVVKMRRIMLEESPEIPPTGLFIGHNGRSYIIKTGVPVMVPEFLVEILDHAVVMSPVIHPQTRQVLNHRPRHRFSYQNLDRVAA